MYVAKRRAKPIVSAAGSTKRRARRATASPSARLRISWTRQRSASPIEATRSQPWSPGASAGRTPWASSSACSSVEIHVRAWTPFVTWPIGTSSTGRSGQSDCHIPRETAPCSSDTPFARADVRSASGVIPKPGSSSWTRPSATKSSQAIPRASRDRSTYLRTSSGSKTSFPAGTGVWVVKIVDARTTASASSSESPSSMKTRSRSSARKAAWPSFMWKTVGLRPSKSSARTPPTPSSSSCLIRSSRSPP